MESSDIIDTDQPENITPTLSITECLELQLQEIEMLQSMFANPGEFIMFNETMIDNVQTFISEQSEGLPNHLDFTIKITVEDKIKLNICIHLPHMYPCIEPEIFVRSDQLNRRQETDFNLDLNKMVLSQERNIMCLYTVIDWIQENVVNFYSDGNLFGIFLLTPKVFLPSYSQRKNQVPT